MSSKSRDRLRAWLLGIFLYARLLGAQNLTEAAI